LSIVHYKNNGVVVVGVTEEIVYVSILTRCTWPSYLPGRVKKIQPKGGRV